MSKETASPASVDSGNHRGRRVIVLGSSLAPDCMEYHVMEALNDMGCAAHCLSANGSAPGRSTLVGRVFSQGFQIVLREPERLRERRLLDAIFRFEPDVVLVIQGRWLSPKTVAVLRSRLKVPILCWYQDAIANLGRQYLLGAEYDAVFVKDRYMQDLFSRMIRSTTFYYLPEACNPKIHRPVPLTDIDRERYSCDVMIAGSLYYYRQEILRELLAFDLRVWGSKPKWLLNRLIGCHAGREAVMLEKVRAVRAARIALNTLHYSEIDGLNCRAFELAGCGAFQLVTHKPVIAEHFSPGIEIETFQTIEELRGKIQFYLEHREEAAAIADSGQKRAHREHTYEHRLRVILDIARSI
jgi:spore maturation protein CgeB